MAQQDSELKPCLDGDMAKSAMLVTPRTHPNLRYLTQNLLANHIRPILLVEKVTSDFVAPNGCLVVTKASEIPFETVDFILFRCFDRALRQIAATKAGRSTVELVYDQRPVGGGTASKTRQLAFLIHRVLLGRPAIRLTPNSRLGRSGGAFAGRYDRYFVHPGPPPLESAVSTTALRFSLVSIAKEFDTRKKIDYLIKVLAHIKVPLDVAIIFSSPEKTGSSMPNNRQRRYRDRIERNIAASLHNIEIFRDLTNEEVLGVLGQSRLFVLLSKKETFSISNIEALSRGTECLVRKDNGSSAYLTGKGTNTFHSPITKKRLAHKISRLIEKSNAERREKISNAYQFSQTKGPSFASLLLALDKRDEI